MGNKNFDRVHYTKFINQASGLKHETHSLFWEAEN